MVGTAANNLDSGLPQQPTGTFSRLQYRSTSPPSCLQEAQPALLPDLTWALSAFINTLSGFTLHD